MTREELAGARRVVLKLGTRVLTDDQGRLALARLFNVVDAAVLLHRRGVQVLLVSSGAVGLGRDALQLCGELDLADQQACAAVGQTRLMGLYEQGFARLGVVCGQVLLTQSDFADRARYLNLRATLNSLLHRGVVPVINENDAVSTEELRRVEGVFGDNDRLSALVASKLEADLLVLLTDVDGVYDRDPSQPLAKLLGEVPPDFQAGGPRGGRGGMRSKVEAARLAARSGCHAVIASGREAGALSEVLAGEAVGSWFPAEAAPTARRRWIAFATAVRGVLVLDAGAVAALKGDASLLAVGVRQVDGTFEAGDVVELRDDQGTVVGRGRVTVSAEVARAWCAGARPEGKRNRDALVERDELVLEEPGHAT